MTRAQLNEKLQDPNVHPLVYLRWWLWCLALDSGSSSPMKMQRALEWTSLWGVGDA